VKLTPAAGPTYKAASQQYRKLKSLLSRLERLSRKALAAQAKGRNRSPNLLNPDALPLSPSLGAARQKVCGIAQECMRHKKPLWHVLHIRSLIAPALHQAAAALPVDGGARINRIAPRRASAPPSEPAPHRISDPQAPKATTGQRTIGIHQRGTYFAYYTPSFAGRDSVPVPATAAENYFVRQATRGDGRLRSFWNAFRNTDFPVSNVSLRAKTAPGGRDGTRQKINKF